VATGAVALGTAYLIATADARGWSAPNRFDAAALGAFRGRSETGRRVAARVSDGLSFALGAYPLLIDPMIVWSARSSPDVAYQTLLIHHESMAIGLAAHTVLADLVGRERPLGGSCTGAKRASLGCTGGGTRGFYAGQVTMAFNG